MSSPHLCHRQSVVPWREQHAFVVEFRDFVWLSPAVSQSLLFSAPETDPWTMVPWFSNHQQKQSQILLRKVMKHFLIFFLFFFKKKDDCITLHRISQWWPKSKATAASFGVNNSGNVRNSFCWGWAANVPMNSPVIRHEVRRNIASEDFVVVFKKISYWYSAGKDVEKEEEKKRTAFVTVLISKPSIVQTK